MGWLRQLKSEPRDPFQLQTHSSISSACGCQVHPPEGLAQIVQHPVLFRSPQSLSILKRRNQVPMGQTNCPANSLWVIFPPSSSRQRVSLYITCLWVEDRLFPRLSILPLWCNASLTNVPWPQSFTVRCGRPIMTSATSLSCPTDQWDHSFFPLLGKHSGKPWFFRGSPSW